MKRYMFFVFLIVIILTLIVLPLLPQGDISVAGKIRIPSADISADVYSVSTAECDCCVELWHGGQASILSDLSAVNIDDWAHLILLDGTYLVLECVEITPCIRVGRWLVSWHGIIKDDGDVLIYNNATVYRFVIL